ncbi:MAG TPA: hypothetical protein VMB91_12250 [Solirubrobacteraceae bacterium]|nr:hypothetical protein [Solirubrobacteraceae bacterium]
MRFLSEEIERIMVMEDSRAGRTFVRRWRLQVAAVLMVVFAAFAASPALAGATVQPSWGSTGGNECTEGWGQVPTWNYGSCQQQSTEFTIRKEQRLKGESSYTTSKLTGKLGETVEYKVTLENTGNVALHFTSLTDAHCSNIQPSGQTELAVGAKESFTCEHTLAKGDESPYKNVAAIEGCSKVAEKEGYTCGHGLGKTPGTSCKYKESNTVEVGIEAETPEIAIHKEQRLHGETNYTASKLTGKVGQTVEYKITVENTGNTALHFTSLTDAHCSNIQPSGQTELAPGAKESFTCEHTLAKGDESPYKNVASIEGCSKQGEKEGVMCGHGYGKTPGTTCKFKESNIVEVVVEAEQPEFAIRKEQRIGTSGSYTKEKLTGKLGQTIDYLITLENTGNVALHFTSLTDAHCSNIQPSGETELAVGAKESFTCEHTLAKGDESPYKNVASIEGCSKQAEKEGVMCGHGYGKTPGTSCKFKESNTVEVVIEPEQPEFTIHKEQRFHGEGSYTTAKLTGKIGQTVEYKVTLENTGNVALHFTSLADAHCSNIQPSGETELAVGGKESFTCEHTLAKGDESPYKNVASIEGCSKQGEKEGVMCGHGYGKTPGTTCKFKESNIVEVGIEAETPEFTIRKEQRIGNSGNYTAQRLSAEVGQTVDYLITVENTGNTTLKFGPLSDAKCTNIQPSGATTVASGGKETFTCEHTLVSADKPEYTNVATIEGGGKEKPSNKVVVEVEEPDFTIEKLQRISGSFTKERLRGEIGQTVQYEIIVRNTGNVNLEVEGLRDANCTNLGGGASEIGVGESAVWTCEHTLTATGEYTNTATVESNEKEKESNEVVVEVPASPSFTIEKLQEIHGTGAGFTKAPLTGTIGQTVDYEIVVTNTGNVSLSLSGLTDAHCTNIGGGAGSLAVGANTTFTCEHVLTAVGSWTNEGTITGTPPGGPGSTETSNQVVVTVPAESGFTVEKKQKLAGEFTTAELTGLVGETVHYEIIVTNTGNVPLKVNSVIDANCTGMSGGASEIGVGGSAIFTCEHTLTSVGPYANEATVVGNEKPLTSNKVVVRVPVENVAAQCTINESAIVLSGASGSKRGPFTIHISSLGVKQITFLLDGKKLATLKSSQAKKGQFSLKINTSKLRYGAHHLTVRTVMTDAACAPIARAAVFVKPHAPAVTPKFTG